MTVIADTVAILVAGGGGDRFGRAGGKQLALAAGLPIVAWSAKALDAVARVGALVVVCPEGRREEYERDAIAPAGLSTPVSWAASGPTRQESVAHGLAVAPAGFAFVAVHDGARPLLTAEVAERVIGELAEDSGAAGAVVGHKSVDTLKVVEGRHVRATPDRDRYWAVQTPQVFRREALDNAHQRAATEAFFGTDDAALVERYGGTVLVVEGPRDNIKVTMPEDLAFVEAALARRRTEESE